MSNGVSTITAKWQVTIPEEVRKELPLKIGQRIVWEADGGKLVGRGVRPVKELAGSLKADVSTSGVGKKEARAAFAEGAIARHQRITKRKA